MFRRSGPLYMLLHTVQNKMVPDFIFTCKSESEIQDKRTHVKLSSLSSTYISTSHNVHQGFWYTTGKYETAETRDRSETRLRQLCDSRATGELKGTPNNEWWKYYVSELLNSFSLNNIGWKYMLYISAEKTWMSGWSPQSQIAAPG